MRKLHKMQDAVFAWDMLVWVMNMYPRLAELREDRDLSQAEMAKVLRVSQSTYSRYENGKLDIPSQALIALSRYYRVSVDYLLGLDDKR